jgi:hypothetical protein
MAHASLYLQILMFLYLRYSRQGLTTYSYVILYKKVGIQFWLYLNNEYSYRLGILRHADS